MKQIRWAFLNVMPAVLAMLFVVWLSQDVPPTQVFGIDTLTRAVKPGGDLVLRFRGVRNRACPVVSSEEIVDGAGRSFQLNARLGNPERKVGPFDIQARYQVPAEAAEGFGQFRSIAAYGIDPFRLCFASHIIGPPARPVARFWIGERPPWLPSAPAATR